LFYRQSYLSRVTYFSRMSCSYCGAEMKDSEFCPKCGMIKIDYQVLSKLKKFFGRSKDKEDDKDKTKPK